MQHHQDQGQVFVTFRTQLPAEYKVDEAEMSMETDLTQKHLCQLVAQMIGQPDLKLEFIIEKEFLRGSLKDHLLRHSVSQEQTIPITYTLALQPPQQEQQHSLPDWLSGLATTDDGHYFVLSMDGTVSRFSKDHSLEYQSKVGGLGDSARSVLALSWKDQQVVVTGGHNGRVSFEKELQGQLVPFLINEDSEASITALDKHPMADDLLVSSDYDGNVTFFKLHNDFMSELESKGTAKPTKKVKTTQPQKQLESLSRHSLTSQAITQVKWCEVSSLVASCMNHQLIIYDVSLKKTKQSINTRDSAVLSMDCPNSNTLLSGHEDGFVRLWDLRTNSSRPQNSFKPHSTMVSDLCLNSSNDFLFASGGYDGQAKVNDLRSQYSLWSTQDKGRVLVNRWVSPQHLVYGGQNSHATSYSFSA